MVIKIRNILFIVLAVLLGEASAHVPVAEVPVVWVSEQATHLCVGCMLAGAHAKAFDEVSHVMCDQKQSKFRAHVHAVCRSCEKPLGFHSKAFAFYQGENGALEIEEKGGPGLGLRHGGNRCWRLLKQAAAGLIATIMNLAIKCVQLKRVGNFFAMTQFHMARHDELVILAPRA